MVSKFRFKDLVFYFGILLNITLIYPAASMLLFFFQFHITPSLYSFPTLAINGGIWLFGLISLMLFLLMIFAIYQKKHKKKSAYYLIWLPFTLGTITYFLFYRLFLMPNLIVGF